MLTNPLSLLSKPSSPSGGCKRKALFSEGFSCLAVRTRLELATPCVTGMYSNQTELPDRLSLGFCFPSKSECKSTQFFDTGKIFFAFFARLICSMVIFSAIRFDIFSPSASATGCFSPSAAGFAARFWPSAARRQRPALLGWRIFFSPIGIFLLSLAFGYNCEFL